MPGAAPNAAAEATLMMPAVAGLPQDRREDVAAVDRAPQVDVEHPVPVVEAHLADRMAARADAGVVDHQRRRPAEPGLRLVGQQLRRRRCCETSQRSAMRLTTVGADRVGRCARGVLVDVAAHDAAAPVGEFDGEGRADAAARAGDDGGGLMAALVR